MKNITIRKAIACDIELLQKISRETFVQTFAASNSEEDMAKYLRDNFSDERLAAELGNSGSEFYFAVSGNDIVGYLKVNSGEAQTEMKEESALEIERIYVLNEYHGRKVGQMLFDKALEIARHKEVRYVWLGVWEKNPRAIRFYRKNGLVAFGQHVFRLGDDEQIDIMMKLEILL